MSSTIMKIENGKFGLSLVDPNVTDVCTATSAQFTDYTCQVTSGALTASPNLTPVTTPATWCSPEETVQSVGRTSYALDLAYLQDPNVVDGLSQFLFEHDTETAWFFMGLDGEDPPKAVGQLRLVAGAIGGAGRTTLTANVSLPVDGKPMVCFGTGAPGDSEGVGGTVTPTGATGGTPGNWTPGNADAPVTLQDANALGLSLGTVWTSGQYVYLADGVTKIHWNGTAFATGAAPTA
jgi:hypothetical protein